MHDPPPQHRISRPPTTHPATRPRHHRWRPRGYRTPGRARRSRPDARRIERRTTGTLAGTVPAPEQWAQEQLKNAPTRSRAWARAVAAIYGLDVREE
jgi:hypothetical protein